MALDPAHRPYGPRLATIRRRADFLRLRNGSRWSGPAFVLEGKPRHVSCDQPPTTHPATTRFGFTITKKIGLAHERNRIRRRLSHALRLVKIPTQLATWDCVIVARRPALDRVFDDLVRDFATAVARLARAPSTPLRAVQPPAAEP